MPKTLTKRGATARFRAKVQTKINAGMSRSDAIRDTRRRYPKLHGLMLLETNAKAPRVVQNSIRHSFGFVEK